MIRNCIGLLVIVATVLTIGFILAVNLVDLFFELLAL